MRPKGSRTHQHLTRSEKRNIAALTREGVKQIEIARRFGCGVDTVRAAQKASGIGRWVMLTPEVEREAVALLRLGHGQYRVAQMCRVSQKKIHKLLAKYRIVHKAGDPGLKLKKPEVYRQLVDAVRKREDFVIRLAEKYGVSPCTVSRIAHENLGDGKFLPKWPPLESYIPQKWFEALPTADDAEISLHIVNFVNGCFENRLIENESRLVEVAIGFSFEVFRRERPELQLSGAEWERVKTRLEPHFRGAVDTLRLAESGPVN
jgi:transposase